jgi:hypothetical protein
MREFYYQVFVSGIALFMMMTGHEPWHQLLLQP